METLFYIGQALFAVSLGFFVAGVIKYLWEKL